ncbi:MAG: hypothetical protein HUK40_06750 [Desulfobacter sp.]|nr:hypothetical protein [Desulfobacter sp.]WDP84787.1 MAG: hypothetical protein HUN05_06185 [Desulfobacter sp.]
MAIFGTHGFVRKQEVGFAKKLLVWKYENSDMAMPDQAALSAQAEEVVEQAHGIAKKRGRNVIDILKETIKEIKTKNHL